MNEILEIIYQWHQGAGFKAIRRSLGFDRNTVRNYNGDISFRGVNALLLIFRTRRAFNFVLRIPGSAVDRFKANVENFSIGQIGTSPVFCNFLKSI